MTRMLETKYDVIVVGAGPGGCTTATLAAQEGLKVLLIEKDRFPRYHIGESLVPGLVPVLAELGILDAVERHGFVDKYGITLIWGEHNERWSVSFDEPSAKGGNGLNKAFQVVRSEFDYLLLQNARKKGAIVLEETRVDDFIFEDERCRGVSIVGANQERVVIHADFVVDASGQANMLGRKRHNIDVIDELKNLAVWSYFQGGTRPAGREAGNIIVENNITDGWLWLIPLHDGTHSVGLVAPQEVFAGRERSLGEMLHDKIAESQHVSTYLKDATRIASFHMMKDWSYACSSFHGPGYLMVGDAAGFVDPLFSTGVFLAMNAGSLAAKTILASLASPEREASYREAYDSTYRGFLDVVTSFVRFFYDASKEREKYFDRAKNLVDPFDAMTARQDFVYLITGLGGVHSVMGMKPDQAMETLSQQIAQKSAAALMSNSA